MSSTEGGFIVLWRVMKDNALWHLSPAVFTFAIKAIERANWKDGRWFDGYKKEWVQIKRGEFISSLRRLSMDFELSVKEIRTAIAVLEKLEFLAHKGAQHYTKITITNYDKYQSIPDDTAQEGARQGHSKGTARATIEQEEQVEQKNLISQTTHLGTSPLPPDVPKPPSPWVQLTEEWKSLSPVLARSKGLLFKANDTFEAWWKQNDADDFGTTLEGMKEHIRKCKPESLPWECVPKTRKKERPKYADFSTEEFMKDPKRMY